MSKEKTCWICRRTSKEVYLDHENDDTFIDFKRVEGAGENIFVCPVCHDIISTIFLDQQKMDEEDGSAHMKWKEHLKALIDGAGI